MNILRVEQVRPVLKQGSSARMKNTGGARFTVGDAVVARRFNHPGHIRLPAYVQGCRGVIAADQGMFIFPDQHANGIKEAQRLYSVRFEAAEIWNDTSSRRDAVYVDLFESYLLAV